MTQYIYSIFFFTSNGFAQWRSIVLLDESPRYDCLAALIYSMERVAATLLPY
jgi:hypothetical protein